MVRGIFVARATTQFATPIMAGSLWRKSSQLMRPMMIMRMKLSHLLSLSFVIASTKNAMRTGTTMEKANTPIVLSLIGNPAILPFWISSIHLAFIEPRTIWMRSITVFAIQRTETMILSRRLFIEVIVDFFWKSQISLENFCICL